MGKALNKLSDSTLKKLVAVQAEKERFYSDGGGLEIKHSKGGKLTWYFRYRTGGRRAVKAGGLPGIVAEICKGKANTVPGMAG